MYPVYFSDRAKQCLCQGFVSSEVIDNKKIVFLIFRRILSN